MPNELRSGDQLLVNDKLISNNGLYFLILQEDGNLVMYEYGGTKAVWATGTNGNVKNAIMQEDGNFVLYSDKGPVWASNTVGSKSFLSLQDDRNLVVYRENGKAVWSSDTWVELLQASSTGKWSFANDNSDKIRIENPPDTVVLTNAKKYFAKGDVVAKLVKGGPAGAYIYAHFHGIHNDRFGETNYKVGIVVRGKKDGYYYLVVPVMDTDVKGVADKSERHRHGKILFTLPPGRDADLFKDAINKGVEMEILITGIRDRDNIFEDIIDKIPPELREPIRKIIIEYITKFSEDVIKIITALNIKR